MLALPPLRLWFCVVTLAVTVASGCAQTARLQVWQPAEFDVVGIHRLAVLDFRGPDKASQQARSELVARLWDSGFFTLADPTELNAVVQTSATRIDDDLGAAIEAGRRLNVDAILVGEVMRYRADDDRQAARSVRPPQRPSGRSEPPAGGGLHDSNLLQREVSVALSLQLIDVRTGQIRAQRQASYRADGEIHAGQGYIPSKTAATRELLQKWAREMTGLLTPHLVSYEVELASPRLGPAAVEIRHGNNEALEGNWAKAAVFWKTALTLEPKSHVAMYNLALAHAAQFDYPLAVQLLEEATQLHPKTMYSETLSRFQRHEQAYLMATAQRRHGATIASLPAAP